MIRIVLLGNGNVAFHLHRALHTTGGVELVQVVGRRPEAFSDFDPEISRGILGEPVAEADVYVIAVSDSAVEEVAGTLRDKSGLVVHTSGARDLEALKGIARPGVLYPLQTFSRERRLEFRDIPARRQLHLAAVFVNNFSNHMVYLGETLCREQELPAALLHPLLRETFSKFEAPGPYQSQTGPARRGDRVTQEAHLRQLKDSLLRELYQIISESIERTYD
ncbi:MAG: DUF2520 domain-containing protein [Robiginitalea sp.]